MNKLRVIIVDDEYLARNGIRYLLENEAEIEIISECKDGVEAYDSILKYNPDLVFLDIQMPGLNGFEVIASLKMKKLPYFIFVTAYDEFALQAFKVHAIDYLLKPVNGELFVAALSRAKQLIKAEQNEVFNSRLNDLISDSSKQENYLKRIIVKDRGKTIVVDIDKIILFTADGDYVKIHTKKENYLFRERLSKISEKLDPSVFCRIHRSTIIRLNQVLEFQPISKGDYFIKTKDDQQFTLSRSYRSQFLQALNQ
ncbi:MAG: DNA-binding response regulator [Calditrichaeota bacterium]|nr:MAG: DNA-binding response regulator [Calditrichota bacterium]MBL1206815.1 DNA-binding response regulator [Calditrichota bacterium]NOG46643.1 response regulator transcription factor [Calditrichota bacterium]